LEEFEYYEDLEFKTRLQERMTRAEESSFGVASCYVIISKSSGL